MKLQEKDSKCPAKHHFAYNNPRISEKSFLKHISRRLWQVGFCLTIFSMQKTLGYFSLQWLWIILSGTMRDTQKAKADTYMLLKFGQIQHIFKKFDIIQLFVDIYHAVHRCWLCCENIYWYLVVEASIHARKSTTNKENKENHKRYRKLTT